MQIMALRRVASFTDSKTISRQSAPLTKWYGLAGNSTSLADASDCCEVESESDRSNKVYGTTYQ